MKVVILGASADAHRFSYKAFKLLQHHGHEIFAVNPRLAQVENVKVYPTLSCIETNIHTLTMYVNPKISWDMRQEIIDFPMKRIIFNPGTENEQLAKLLEAKKVQVVYDCTLIMLNEGRF